MLIGTIYLTQTHLLLRDVDGSEVSITLDDTIDLYTFVKDRLQEIEERRLANWQEYLTLISLCSDHPTEGVHIRNHC